MTTLGFIGLGAMGSRMVKRLLRAGYSVTGYNRTRAKAEALLQQGMKWGNSPRAVVEAADITFSMVAHDTALTAIFEGPAGVLAGLGPNKIYVDMSTVSPALSRDLARQAAEKGGHMLDAPVSGSTVTLEQGQLSIMVGGERSAFEQAKPALLAIGPKVTYLGASGSAAVMKIAVNLSIGVQIQTFCEGVILAEKSGIDRQAAVDVLLNSAVASPVLKYRGPFVLDQMAAETAFPVDMMQKDLRLGLNMGRELGVALPTTATMNELLTVARGMGLAEKDYAVVFQVMARMAGLTE